MADNDETLRIPLSRQTSISIKKGKDFPKCLRFDFRTPEWMKEAIAEFMGTFILMTFGLGSNAQVVLSQGTAGNYFSINIAWGMAVTMGVYWAGSVSGAHLNPAVTLGFASVQRLPLWKVPIYITSQMLSSIMSSALVYALYHDAIDHYDGGVRRVLGPNGTAGIFTSFPQPFVSNFTGFCDQFFGTAMLLALIFALVDKKNESKPTAGLAPIAIGLVVVLIGMTFGYNCGCPINPALDLGPRIFTAMAGWGKEVFTAHNNWSWIPPVACSLGGIAGAYLYVLTVEIHRKPETKKNKIDTDNEQIAIDTIQK
ncbi:aquaporin-3-like isoform X2 [Xenia sp. Carnegie-2017]|uniref:aquaporin-3-like isoform X2 n=1 Tax=Xenia sp. Carnegie-2017 TaxID=2897299 RepID=UPI001F0496C7|nr:aquaporin-3-like isoform X2 [Xenia sp. Carnegie-2017]